MDAQPFAGSWWALCVCGWAAQHGEERAVYAHASNHAAQGPEGCDHVIAVEWRNAQNEVVRRTW